MQFAQGNLLKEICSSQMTQADLLKQSWANQ